MMIDRTTDGNVAEFGRRCDRLSGGDGPKSGAINRYLGGSEPGAMKLAVMCQVAGCRIEWALTGRGPYAAGGDGESLAVAEPQINYRAEFRPVPGSTPPIEEQMFYGSALAAYKKAGQPNGEGQEGLYRWLTSLIDEAVRVGLDGLRLRYWDIIIKKEDE